MNGFDRFFVEGLRAAERTLPLLRPITQRDQDAVVDIAHRSVIARAMGSAIAVVGTAWDRSAAVNSVRTFWRRLTLPQRRLLLGIAAIVAATVNVTLLLWHEPSGGWFWLLPPALAVAWGTLMIVFAAAGPAQSSVSD